jgi:hypothetical protein
MLEGSLAFKPELERAARGASKGFGNGTRVYR